MLRLVEAILSPAAAEGRREWLDGFLVGDDVPGSEVVARLRAELSPGGLDLDCHFAADRADLERAIRTADVVVCEQEPIDADLLARAERLRLVQKFGTDLRTIDLAAAADHGVLVATVRRGGNRRVAEHSLALMLALVKGVARGDRAVRAGVNADVPGPLEDWAYNWPHVPGLGAGLRGLTLGLLGFGEIGLEVALLAQAFGMELLYHQRTRDPRREAQAAARYVSKDELFRAADVVDIHLPATPGTRGIVGAPELAAMKPTAFLVNTSRAGVVDEAALVDALESGSIAGAALDNFWREPLPADHPLMRLDNVVLTPHIAGGRFDAAGARSDVGGVVENVARVAAGRLPLGVVNLPA
jgi:phosphoglycerate dehydrogenase-like enzyme